ncbi:oxidoreductase-like domain-containing protein 1 [Rhagoletis pomonella]|uniref:oxidoreductase-like domain-containing protein 1 n=1 Tax=Rhagoletis pomonella TaxID=28610 RepID=UPI0017816F6D|nr:oxidoreductase-like domain-containing protein 1 [Rhagoletis pomonella]XP_036324440.1 oxidoreductase-like domain-containing protein 1 [Rhagoletis pomonella]XP_036324442.1 oxidoreductase-like domain-containing protein 1 [Rhagoletis pomonella]
MYPAFRLVSSKPAVWLKPLPKVVISRQKRMLSQKPESIKLPPTPEACCLAGCKNCVWVEYAHKIADLMSGYDERARGIILNRVSDPVLRSFLKVELKSILEQREGENIDK